MMSRELRLLLIDDSEDDAMLLARELSEAGYELTTRQVFTAEGVRAAFAEEWDLVISDWSMPDRFTALTAFEIMRELGRDLPFVIVSGTIDDELAVSALKAGVHDFMTKTKLARLVPAIERELRESGVRRRQRETDAKLAHQRLQLEASERLLRTVLDSVPDAVVVVDHRGHVVLRNSAAIAKLDIRDSDVDFATWRRHIATFQAEKADIPAHIEEDPVLQRALRGEEVDRQVIRVEPDAQAASLWLSASARPLRNDGQIVGAVGVFRDITSDRAAQEQLLISDRMASIGMLASGVAHEVNNPLAAVVANLELATEVFGQPGGIGEADIPEVIEMLRDAKEATDRVRQIVKDLKIFSRHQIERRGSVELTNTLESTLRMAGNEIRHRATLRKSFGETTNVAGTESRLGQVFLNLVLNAAQAIPEGDARSHTIGVTTGMAGPNRVFVEISDTGSGMSPETLRQIFTPFFTTKRQGEGTGLGLTISHRIISELGGTLEVESQLGQGTTFRVLLPVAQEEAGKHVQQVSEPPVSRRVRVLAIDDEPLITAAIRRILGADHDVDVATDATHALDQLRGGSSYDLILCDLMMPQMTGMEFFDWVQVHKPDHAERVVFMTGDAFTSAARTFLDEVSNQCIDKPFDARFLRALVGDRFKTG